MLLQSRFEFTTDDRAALAKHLCDGGHADVASEIIDDMEDWLRYWRDRDAAMLLLQNVQRNKVYVFVRI
jgi:hypothetical protein